MKISGVIFDFIGTTVLEKDPLMINRCFTSAFSDHGVKVSDEFIKENRGKDKTEVVTNALRQFDYPVNLVEPIADSLKIHLNNNLDNFFENGGARETIRYLKDRGIIVGIGTGLPRDTFEKILQHLKWDEIGFDYIGVAEKIGRGRPHPDMILDMLNRHELKNGEFLKVGDTVADILEGKNANVWTAVILSGTQEETDLKAQEPDYVIRSLAELKDIVK